MRSAIAQRLGSLSRTCQAACSRDAREILRRHLACERYVASQARRQGRSAKPISAPSKLRATCCQSRLSRRWCIRSPELCCIGCGACSQRRIRHRNRGQSSARWWMRSGEWIHYFSTASITCLWNLRPSGSIRRRPSREEFARVIRRAARGPRIEIGRLFAACARR